MFRKHLAFAALAVVASQGAANAAVTTFTSATAFAAAAAITNVADFEGLPAGRSYAPLTEGGITIRPLAIDIYINPAGAALTRNSVYFSTQALSADGDENFDFRLQSGATFGAIGLDYATNAYGAPVLSLYDAAGSLIASLTVPQKPETLGFFGVISSTPIAYARSIVDRGYYEDTAVDNVRLGFEAAGVPEPASWALMMVGFGLSGTMLRRRLEQLCVEDEPSPIQCSRPT